MFSSSIIFLPLFSSNPFTSSSCFSFLILSSILIPSSIKTDSSLISSISPCFSSTLVLLELELSPYVASFPFIPSTRSSIASGVWFVNSFVIYAINFAKIKFYLSIKRCYDNCGYAGADATIAD
ncbi:unnamed protein product [Meloidogyne enterolobii]|uniref:Uncharacterized protein n=1 Tax=Meloidogyne enterolobii TaxID=390850 RepID=A0ACB0YZX7_MELEN